MPNFYNIIRAKKFNTAADTALEIAPYGSATPNFSIDAGGKLRWSSGSATADTTLYRTAASALKTDGSIEAVTGLTAATPSFSGPLTSAGVATFQNTLVLQQSKEKFTVSAAAIGPTVTNVDVLSGAVYYYTGTITDLFKFNIRGNSSNTLASILTTDSDAVTVVLMIENVSSAKSFAASSYLTIDTNATVAIKWFGGSKPAGNIGTDVYTLTIYKTGTSAFTVFASQSKFA